MKIELFKGKDGQWYWRVRASNGQIFCTSEGYVSYGNAERAAESFRGQIIADPSLTIEVV